MATFTAAGSTGVDMMLLFGWVDGNTPIEDITFSGDFVAYVFGDTHIIGYVNEDDPAGFSQSDDAPTGGTFTKAEIYVSEILRGGLSGFTVTTDNFADIVNEDAFGILDGDDTLNGGAGSDILFGGYKGSDTFDGGGGGDRFFVAAGSTPVAISGTVGKTDTITVVENLNGQEVLNLRETALSSINELVINDGLVIHLNSSQIGTGAGVSGTATILSAFGAGLLVVFKDAPGAVDLSDFTVTGDATVSILGTSAGEAITGTNGKDILTPGNGNDTVNGLGGNDTFNAVGTDSQFDTFNGGSGSDTLKVFLPTPLTLNGFNAASQSIEVWDGHGQTLFGNGSGNVFNLAGLTSMTGLPFVEGLGGNDTMTGSKFVDRLLGGDGDDTISAGVGDDELEGGLGKDTMTGGLGGDRFDFDAVAEIGKKKGLLDLVTDWGDGDTIDLSSIDANGAKKGDKAWKFLKKEGADFTKAGQVGFDQKKSVTYVQGDSNGDGKADFKLAVTGKIDFEKADFVL